MKAFKKLMAAALVCVMALTVLTGCGVADKKTKEHMVDALNNQAKEDKSISWTYNETDAMDKIAESAMKKAQDAKKISGAEVATSYEMYTVKLTDTWNSTDDLKGKAKDAHAKFVAANPVVKDSKVAVGVCVDKVDGDNYLIAVVEKTVTVVK